METLFRSWKKLRSAGQELLNKTATAKFYAINMRDAVDLVQNLLQDSKDWSSEFGRCSVLEIFEQLCN